MHDKSIAVAISGFIFEIATGLFVSNLNLGLKFRVGIEKNIFLSPHNSVFLNFLDEHGDVCIESDEIGRKLFLVTNGIFCLWEQKNYKIKRSQFYTSPQDLR